MFGKNIVSGPRLVADGYLVKEIWHTIQGEGPWMGRPAIFIRFAGCNLRCFFCDTDFDSGSPFTSEALTAHVRHLSKASGTKRIVLTGGEPMLQDVHALARWLPEMVFQVETAGTVVNNTSKPPHMQYVVSPKTPKINSYIAAEASAFKYIINAAEVDAEDGLPTGSTQAQGIQSPVARPPHKASPVYVQPMDVGDTMLNLANAEACARIALKHGYFVSLQMHKLLGLP